LRNHEDIDLIFILPVFVKRGIVLTLQPCDQEFHAQFSEYLLQCLSLDGIANRPKAGDDLISSLRPTRLRCVPSFLNSRGNYKMMLVLLFLVWPPAGICRPPSGIGVARRPHKKCLCS
jgi:hypothetical protein